jgi:hypothetical protein
LLPRAKLRRLNRVTTPHRIEGDWGNKVSGKHPSGCGTRAGQRQADSFHGDSILERGRLGAIKSVGSILRVAERRLDSAGQPHFKGTPNRIEGDWGNKVSGKHPSGCRTRAGQRQADSFHGDSILERGRLGAIKSVGSILRVAERRLDSAGQPHFKGTPNLRLVVLQ